MTKINMYNTTISDGVIDLVTNTLKSTFISAGKKAEQFESDLFPWVGKTVTVNSGTAALHLALVSAHIGYGDEVILSPQTFIATGLAIKYCGAIPVFADIEYSSGNISPDSIKDKITDKTKAIIVVHWGGYPCDMDKIQEIANQYNLLVIEDAAHAFGAKYKNKNIGTISDYTCFSFQSIKHLTTGDGGAVSSLNDDNIKRLKKLRWFNIDRDLDKEDELGERVYNSNEVGYKYHMNDVTASIGIANLNTIEIKLKKHRDIANKYHTELNNVSGIKLFERKNDRLSSDWLFGFHVENRFNFIKKLKSEGISSSVVHLGIDKNDLFGGCDLSLINQREFDKTQIHIPIHDGLTDDNVNKIIKTIKSGW